MINSNIIGITKKRYTYDKFGKDIWMFSPANINWSNLINIGRWYESKNNENYIKSNDGYFYKLDKRYLDYYPELESPDNTSNYDKLAFYECDE